MATNIPTALNVLMKKLNDYPLLTKAEEQLYFKRLNEGDDSAFEHIFLSNLRLVFSIAKNIQNKQKKQHFELNDLFQFGTLGLKTAIDKFDPSLGYKFSTYATFWIKQSITRNIMDYGDSIHIPVHVTEDYKRYNYFINDFHMKNQRLPTNEEIKQFCKANKIDENTMKLVNQNKEVLSLNQTVSDDKESNELEYFIPSKQNLKKEIHEKINNQLLCFLAKENLNALDYYVVFFRYLNDKPKTLEQLGDFFGITNERIRQIETKALVKLKQRIYNKDKELISASIPVNYITNENILPESITEIANYLYAKEILTEEEYYLYYYYQKYGMQYSYKMLQDIYPNLTPHAYQNMVQYCLKKFSPFHENNMLNDFIINLKEKYTTTKIFQLDKTPVSEERILSLLEEKKLLNKSQESIIKDDPFPKIIKDERFFRRFIDQPMKELENDGESIYRAERELNLLLFNYHQERKYFNKEKLYEVYINHKNRFTLEQQCVLEYYYFYTLSNKQLKEMNIKLNQLKSNQLSFLMYTLERIYIGTIDMRRLYSKVTSNMVENVLKNYPEQVNEEYKTILNYYYFFHYPKEQIQKLLNYSYEQVRDKLKCAQERILYLNYGLSGN